MVDPRTSMITARLSKIGKILVVVSAVKAGWAKAWSLPH